MGRSSAVKLLPLALVGALAALGCAPPQASPAGSSSGAPSASAPAGGSEGLRRPGSGSAAGASSSVPAPSASAAAAPSPLDAALAGAGWGAVSRELSEQPGDFPSDNLISNETSLLQPAAELAARAPGGAYLGVGPEQSFTYLAVGRPELAIIVDIRRDNLLLHALYRAFFVQADDRAAFACRLFARRCERARSPDEPDALLRDAARAPFSAAVFDEEHAAAARLVAGWGLELSDADRKRMRAIHERFAKEGPGLRFEMREPSGRTYPTLSGLLSSPAWEPGAPRSFFATEQGYAFVRDLERRGRVVPVVGDFAGPKAIRGAGALVRRHGLSVRTFYVSNVEQYLLADRKWRPWVENVASLPLAADAVLVRGYLDQGKRHPAEREGHRTATVVQPAAGLLERGPDKPYASFFDAATDRAKK